MEKYIRNLTNSLIGQHGFDTQFAKTGDPDEFVRKVKSRLLLGAVQEMTPQTIGKIISKFNFESNPEDLKEVFFNEINLDGNFKNFQQEVAAFLLAVEIGETLQERNHILAIAD